LSRFRPERVAEQIHKEVTRLLMEQVKDPRVVDVSVSEVKVSRDISYATLYYTIADDQADLQEIAQGLRSIEPFLRHEVGRLMQLRQVPELRFKYDSSVAYGRKIDALLRQVQTDLDDDETDR
jgi:ribosome-binding factor A